MRTRVGRSPGVGSSSSGAAVQQERARADRHADRDQHKPQPEAEGKVALAGLERDGRRHGAGEPPDVAADDDDRPDLGDGAAECRQEGGQERIASNHE